MIPGRASHGAAGGRACSTTPLEPILLYISSRESEITQLIRAFVECESPSDDRAAVDRFVDLVADSLASEALIRVFPGGRFGRHVRAEFVLPGRRKAGQILALGHSDTVWPMGTLAQMPWREAPDAAGRMRLWG
ncbi:MAG: hypothetical protein EXQ52_05595, partial [Bryobacterales bacterium]|nr:hypothetical protein [Bryobacterales bacterium]